MSLVFAGEGMRPRGACFVQGMGSRWLDGVSFVQGMMGWACFVQGYLCIKDEWESGAGPLLCARAGEGAERTATSCACPHAGRGENSDLLLYYCTMHTNTKTKPLHLESRGLSAPPLPLRSLHPT
eukprot:scaffold33617_cov96-Isochrysis_galbana.AAC.1